MQPTLIQKRQKPIDYDVHLKYRCSSCERDHWLSLAEAKTKNFKIVCECGLAIKPKLINQIKLIYHSSHKSKLTTIKTEQKVEENVPVDLLNKCTKILGDYGFEPSEAKKMVTKCFVEQPTSNCLELIKHVLTYFGALKNE